MKTTLNLNDTLLVHAKLLAAQQQTTLSRLVEEGLQLRLQSQHARASARPAHRLPVFKGRGGLVAGLNSLSNKALIEAAAGDA